MVVLIIEQISIQREFYTFDYTWGGGGGGGRFLALASEMVTRETGAELRQKCTVGVLWDCIGRWNWTQFPAQLCDELIKTKDTKLSHDTIRHNFDPVSRGQKDQFCKFSLSFVECYAFYVRPLYSPYIVMLWLERSKGWRSGENTRLPPMWPGFKSRRRRHMWVEFVVGSLLCSERVFFRVLRFSPLLKNQHLHIPIRPGIR